MRDESRVDGRHERSAKSRTVILDAAARLFSTTGFQATSLRAIAQEIGMSQPGLQRHFPTKGTLLTALLARGRQFSDDYAATVDITGTPPRELTRLAAEHALASHQERDLHTVLLGEATDPRHPAHGILGARFDTAATTVTAAFGSGGHEIVAGWAGLVLLHSYLPDRIDPVAVIDARIRRLEDDLDRVTTVAVVGEVRAEAQAGPRSEVVTVGSGSASAPTEPTASPQPGSAPLSPAQHVAASGKLTAQRIVAAAAAAFARNGYRGTSLRQIAADLHTSHGALLYWFQNKQALLEAVLDSRDASPVDSFADVDTALADLAAIHPIAKHNETDLELVRLYQVLVCESINPAHPAHEYFRRRFETVLDRVTASLSVLRDGGVLADGVDPVEDAIWVTALWEGLQVFSFYREGLAVSERLQRHLAGLVTVDLPEVVPPQFATVVEQPS